MKKGKWTLLLVLTFVLGFILTSCGNNNSSKTASTANNSNDDGETKITWWAFPNFQPEDGELGKYEQSVIDAFEKKNPDIKVDLQMISYEGGPEKMNLAIASNTAPDVIFDGPGRILDWAKKDLLIPLNDMFTDDIINDIQPALMAQSKVGDDIYMYPFNTAPFMMAVNKTIFEDIDAVDLLPLDRPDRTWSVEEYEKALRAVKEKATDIIPSGFYAKSSAGDQGTRAYIANLGGSKFLNDDFTKVAINTDGGVDGLKWLVDAANDDLVAPGSAALDAGDHNDLFLQGKMAFAINYSAVLKKLFAPDKATDFEDVLLPYPTPDGSAPKLEPFLGGFAIFDNGDDAKAEASKKLVDFIINDPEWGEKDLKQTGGLSARDSITGIYDGPAYDYSELARKFMVKPPSLVDGYDEMRTFWFPALQQAILGKETPKEALDEFAKKTDTAIEKAAKKNKK